MLADPISLGALALLLLAALFYRSVSRRLGRPSWFGVAFATPGIGLLLRLTVTESGLARAVRELSLED